MNIAKHMEAIVIVAAVALTAAAALASPAGSGHTGDASASSFGKPGTVALNTQGTSAKLGS